VDVLFVHQNFPGQFRHLAPAMAARPGHRVLGLSLNARAPGVWQGVRVLPYRVARGNTPGLHPWLVDFETKTLRGEACVRAAQKLKQQGFEPRVIVAHPGWGESLFLKQLWPRACLGLYAEFYYQGEGADSGFDPEFPDADPLASACRLQLKNLNHHAQAHLADGALSPTGWQAASFPADYRARITVAHDGIDTDALRPEPSVRFAVGADGPVLTREDEVVTFVARQLEPYRGYHVFMRALPGLLRARPRARVLVVGGDEVAYGARRADGRSWKQALIDEVRPAIAEADWARVHFLGTLERERFTALLQLSRLHVYLSYPFVLSWSLLEAMSVGACVLASDTAPVREAITDGESGRLVDFFDVQGLVDRACELLDDAAQRARLGAQARALAQARYDLRRVCLPAQLAWVDALVATRPPGAS